MAFSRRMFVDLLSVHIPSALADMVIEYISCDDHLRVGLSPEVNRLKHRLKVYPPDHPEAIACHLLLFRQIPPITVNQIKKLSTRIRHLVIINDVPESRFSSALWEFIKDELMDGPDIHLLLTHPQLPFTGGGIGMFILERILGTGRCEDVETILSHPNLTLNYDYLSRVVEKNNPNFLRLVLPLYQPHPQMIHQAMCLCIEQCGDDVVYTITQFVLDMTPYVHPTKYDPMVAALKYRLRLVPRLLQVGLFRKDFNYAKVIRGKLKTSDRQYYLDMIAYAQE